MLLINRVNQDYVFCLPLTTTYVGLKLSGMETQNAMGGGRERADLVQTEKLFH